MFFNMMDPLLTFKFQNNEIEHISVPDHFVVKNIDFCKPHLEITQLRPINYISVITVVEIPSEAGEIQINILERFFDTL